MKLRAISTQAAAAAVRQKLRSMTSLPGRRAGAAGDEPGPPDVASAVVSATASVANSDSTFARSDGGAASRPTVLRTAALKPGSSNSLSCSFIARAAEKPYHVNRETGHRDVTQTRPRRARQQLPCPATFQTTDFPRLFPDNPFAFRIIPQLFR